MCNLDCRQVGPEGASWWHPESREMLSFVLIRFTSRLSRLPQEVDIKSLCEASVESDLEVLRKSAIGQKQQQRIEFSIRVVALAQAVARLAVHDCMFSDAAVAHLVELQMSLGTFNTYVAANAERFFTYNGDDWYANANEAPTFRDQTATFIEKVLSKHTERLRGASKALMDICPPKTLLLDKNLLAKHDLQQAILNNPIMDKCAKMLATIGTYANVYKELERTGLKVSADLLTEVSQVRFVLC